MERYNEQAIRLEEIVEKAVALQIQLVTLLRESLEDEASPLRGVAMMSSDKLKVTSETLAELREREHVRVVKNITTDEEAVRRWLQWSNKERSIYLCWRQETMLQSNDIEQGK